MKPYIAAGIAFLATLAAARVVPSSHPSLDDLTHGYNSNITEADGYIVDLNEPATSVADANAAWDKAVESGRTLNSAMKSKDSVARWLFKNHPDFAETVQSPFDGDLREKLREWGYNDNDELSKKVEKDCDFDEYHKIKRAFSELGLDTKARKDGGPNQCFRIDHQDGPNVKRKDDGTLPGVTNQHYDVCGKEYRVTGGTFEFAVNPAGAIALMNVISPAYSAEKHAWGRKPATHELPHIRSTSDIAWGVWNRAGAVNLKDIKYLFVTQILNAGTRDLIRSALATLSPPASEYKVWPGHEFDMDSAGGQAILGSPVGRWAGYFLAQHKDQLGGNRFISKARVFKNDNGSLPYLVFYIDPNAAPGGSEDGSGGEGGESWTVKRSVDGKKVVREHVIHVNHVKF